MDLERLAEFAAIAKHGTLKEAASVLGISVATLSARLIRFEEHLGVPLFHRTGSVMTLTNNGRQLLPNALEILAQYETIRQDMHRAKEHSYNKLRIAVTGSSLPLHLGPFLDKLVLEHPDIQLELMDDSRYGIEDALSSGFADIYFAPILDRPVPKNLFRQFVGFPGEYVLLPRSHPLADRSMISIRELDGECFILYPETAEPAIRDFQLNNLRDSGIRYSTYESSTSVIFSKLLVPIGKGILLNATHMMDLPPNTVCIPVTDLPHHSMVCFFYRKTDTSPDVLAFARDYLSYAKEVTGYEHRKNL